MTGKTEMIILLDPTAKSKVSEKHIAPRVNDLNGKVIGFLNNGKANADILLARIEEVLSKQFKFSQVIKQNKRNAARAVSETTIEELTGKCDVVVNAMGD